MNKKQRNIPKRGERQKPSQMRGIPHRGEIWVVEFLKSKESRKFRRPCLVISNDIQNEYGKWIVVVAMTTQDIEIVEPFEVFIKNTLETGLDEPSKLKFNYPRTVDRERLKKHLGVANKKIMEQAEKAWKIAFDWWSNE